MEDRSKKSSSTRSPIRSLRTRCCTRALTTLDDIYEHNATLLMPVDHFFTAYDNLQLESAESLVLDSGATQLLHVAYTLGGATYHGYAYAPAAPQTDRPASLIIPGSGLNCSEPIFRKDPASYHDGIIDALGEGITNYVFIKPNEDCLAFHNGAGKVNVAFFVNWLLNNATSFSAAYIVSAMAITKYLQGRHENVVVAGLSQGGGAALLTALQSKPTAAVIASGFLGDHGADPLVGAQPDYHPRHRPGLQQRERARRRLKTSSYAVPLHVRQAGKRHLPHRGGRAAIAATSFRLVPTSAANPTTTATSFTWQSRATSSAAWACSRSLKILGRLRCT